MRIAIVATHPIQHFCPQYRVIAALPDVDLTVIFASLKGVEPYHDRGFGAEVSWGSELLDGYRHVDLSEGRKLSQVLDGLHPDWLIVYGYASRVARDAWAWAFAHPRQKLAYISDSELRHRYSRTREGAKAAAVGALFRRVNAFLTVGDANEEYYSRRGVPRRKLVRMHFPIDPNLTFSAEAGRAKRAELGVDPSRLIVLNVGKFQKHKRQRDLIEAVAQTANTHLLLAGSGEELEECKRISRDLPQVSFLGFKQPAELAAFYAMADVYAHPSSYDPHPLAVSEAAAAGSALLVSDATGSWGPSDDVIPGETGYVFPLADVGAIATMIRGLEGDRQLCREMGARARKNSRGQQMLACGGFLDALAEIA